MTDRRSDHRAALRDCRLTFAADALAIVMLWLGLFVIDLTPHVQPDYPKSVGLTIGSGIALVILTIATVIQYRQTLTIARRRRLG
jgi:ABC-type transport system involved in cytochrome c biogenesis permease component